MVGCPPALGVQVAPNPMRASPPVFVGGAKETESDPVGEVVERARTLTPVALPGRVAATNVAEGADAGPVPVALVARTVQL